MSDTGVYTVYSYGDEEIKGVFESLRVASQFMLSITEPESKGYKVQYWIVQKEVKK